MCPQQSLLELSSFRKAQETQPIQQPLLSQAIKWVTSLSISKKHLRQKHFQCRTPAFLLHTLPILENFSSPQHTFYLFCDFCQLIPTLTGVTIGLPSSPWVFSGSNMPTEPPSSGFPQQPPSEQFISWLIMHASH